MPSTRRQPGPLTNDAVRSALLRQLVDFLPTQRWFGAKARPIRGLSLVDAISLTAQPHSDLVVLKVNYSSGPPELYLLAVTCRRQPGRARGHSSGDARPPIAVIPFEDGSAVCSDGLFDPDVQGRLLGLVTDSQRLAGARGTVVGQGGSVLRRLLSRRAKTRLQANCRVLGKEQSNTSLLYGRALFLKVLRKLQEGAHPDVEIGRFLSEKARFRHVPPFAGCIEYRRTGHQPVTLGMLQVFVPNRGDGWGRALALLTRYFERVRLLTKRRRTPPPAAPSPLAAAKTGQWPIPQRLLGREAFRMATLLGKRTAELHVALASDRRDPAFAPEPCSPAYQRTLVRQQLAGADGTFRLLTNSLSKLPGPIKRDAEATLALRQAYLARLRGIGRGRLSAVRIRCHGDYHLGQVLYTGNDFMIIDFEGEPAKPLRERREKHPPFRDTAGMMRSFHYAAYAGLFPHAHGKEGVAASELGGWADAWYVTMAGLFLRTYLDTLSRSALLPRDPAVTARLLEAFLLEKALYEVSYELNNRPSWLRIPLTGIRQMFGPTTESRPRG